MPDYSFNETTGQFELAGAAGKDGRAGIDGKDGRDGKDGFNGIDGKNGRDGKAGLDGLRGQRGAKGDIGADGKDGFMGEDGDPGLDGKDGKDGDPANRVYHLQKKPGDEFGMDGDWCFTELSEMFVREGGKWKIYRMISAGGISRVRKLQDIGNIKITNLAINDVLVWNGSYWENTAMVEDKTILYDYVSASVTYFGYAAPGSAEGSSVWKIKKMVTTGSDFTVAYANGAATYVNSWTNRASYTYS